MKEYFYDVGGNHNIVILACDRGDLDILKFFIKNGLIVKVQGYLSLLPSIINMILVLYEYSHVSINSIYLPYKNIHIVLAMVIVTFLIMV